MQIFGRIFSAPQRLRRADFFAANGVKQGVCQPNFPCSVHLQIPLAAFLFLARLELNRTSVIHGGNGSQTSETVF
jgi:hypothetical protein